MGLNISVIPNTSVDKILSQEQEPPFTGQVKETILEIKDNTAEVLPVEQHTTCSLDTTIPESQEKESYSESTNVVKVIEIEPVKVSKTDVVRKRKRVHPESNINK